MTEAAGVPVPGVLARRSSGEQVAAHVRSLIFNGRLRQGDRIRQDDLAASLGVSRIPVREAIIALDREGWVTNEPHRGAYVNGFDRETIADHYEMLGLLYGLTARKAASRGSDEALAKLAELAKELRAATDPDEVVAVNDRLMRQMFAAAASPRLSAVSRVMTAVVPGNFFDVVPGSVADQKKGMTRIVAAITGRDADRAADEWLRLLRRQGSHVVDLLEKGNLLVTRTSVSR